MSTPQQTSSAVVPRVVDGKLVSLYARPPRLDSSLPQVRDLAAAPLPQQQAERSTEDSSDDLSQSSASSTGGRSGAASNLSSMHPPPQSACNQPYRPAPPPNKPRAQRVLSLYFNEKMDQVLTQLVDLYSPDLPWTQIATDFTRILSIEKSGKQCRERCVTPCVVPPPAPPRPSRPPSPQPSLPLPPHTPQHRKAVAPPPLCLYSLTSTGRARAGGTATWNPPSFRHPRMPRRTDGSWRM